MLMASLVSFCVATIVIALVIRSGRRHVHISGDTDLSGPQKLHAQVVPRVGGLGLFFGFMAGAGMLAWQFSNDWALIGGLILCALPAFLSGLLEDFTKTVSVRRRLVSTALSAALGAYFLGAVISKTDIPGLDLLSSFPVGAGLLAVFVVTGVSNSINIIDGINGLASMCIALMLAGLSAVAWMAGDTLIAQLALVMASSVLGFFIWNYPKGLVFLGDGGAYFMGFIFAELSILLLERNPQISPLFPLLLAAYPVFETVFSMYRRKIVRGQPVGKPDGIHLHTLIYRRLMRWALGRTDNLALRRRNSMTAPYLWILCLLGVLPAALLSHSTMGLSICFLLFSAFYIFIYARIVRFKTPRALVREREPAAVSRIKYGDIRRDHI
jgi:UDP-N-acetylmuramyl pentapeptide phosphotransferase/UDP-N-acetylglucosamine-1-phosphate transferase